MSYSFKVQAATKDAVKQLIAEQMKQVVKQQSCHKLDVPIAIAAVNAQIDALPDVKDKDIRATMYGSVSGLWSEGTYQEIHAIQADQAVAWVARGS